MWTTVEAWTDPGLGRDDDLGGSVIPTTSFEDRANEAYARSAKIKRNISLDAPGSRRLAALGRDDNERKMLCRMRALQLVAVTWTHFFLQSVNEAITGIGV